MGVTPDRQCDICNIGFPTEYSLREHRLSLMHHKILNHQLRNQGMHDPEHFCFLCQKSLSFNAWADHLLDHSHRQRVLAMKAEEQTSLGLSVNLQRPGSCDLPSVPSLSVNGSQKGIDKADSFSASHDNRQSFTPPEKLSDTDWMPEGRLSRQHQRLSSQSPATASRLLDSETEQLLKKTQTLLRDFSARHKDGRVSLELRANSSSALQGRRFGEEVDEMTPISSLATSARSDIRFGGDTSASSSLSSALVSGSSSRQRIRRRAARRSNRSSSSSFAAKPPPGIPVIEPVVGLHRAQTASPSPFHFGFGQASRGFNFSFGKADVDSMSSSSAVTRMHEALLLSKEEEALKARVAEVDERLETLNGRLETLLAQITAEEEVKDRLREKEMELHERRMRILKTFCAPHSSETGSQDLEDEEEEEEEEEDEEEDVNKVGSQLFALGLDTGRSTSPDVANPIPDFHIGDQTRRDILSKIMEKEASLEESSTFDEESQSVPQKEVNESSSSSDTVRLRRTAGSVKSSEDRRPASRNGSHASVKSPLRRQRDPSMTALMKEYLHHQPSSSDADLEQTPRSPVAVRKGNNTSDDVSGISSSTSLPSTAAQIFPGLIYAHDSCAVLDMCVYKGYLYSAGEDATVRKFSLQSHECLCEYRGHSKLVHCIALSDESKGEDRLFSGGFDNTLFIFNVKTGAEVNRCAFDAAVHALTIAWSVLHIGLANGRLLGYSLPKRCLQPGPRSLTSRPITCLTALEEENCLLVGADGDGIRVVGKNGSTVLLHILPTEMDLLPLAAIVCRGRILSFYEHSLLCYDFHTGVLAGRVHFPTRISCLSQTTTHVFVGTVAGRVHRVRASRFLQDGETAYEEEEDEDENEGEDISLTSVQISAANEAILSMTCHRDTLFVGDEKGRISIRQM